MALSEKELDARKEELKTFDEIRSKLVDLLKSNVVEVAHIHPDYVAKINTASSALLSLMTCSDMSMQLKIEMDRLEIISVKMS